MTPRRRAGEKLKFLARIAAASVALIVGATLAACSSTSNGGRTAAAPSKTTQSASDPTGFASTSTSASTPTSGGLTQAQAQAALLTADEIGGGVAQTRTDSDAPLPCRQDEPPLSRQFSPDAKAQVAFVGTEGDAMFSEEIETFADAGTLDKVIQTVGDGLSCEAPTTVGAPVRIDGPAELTAQLPVPVDFAEVWTLRSSELHATLVIAQMGQEFVVFRFGAAPTAATSKQPNAILVLEAGLRKLETALK